MNGKKNAIKGVLAGTLNYIITLLLPFVSRTIIIYSLGISYVGLGGLFNSIISVLNISELGFGSALSYLLYKPVAENDTKKINALLKYSKKIFMLIGIAVVSLGILFLPYIDSLTTKDRPEGLNIYILYFIYLLNTSIGYFMYAHKRLIFSAYQRYDIETSIASVSLILQYVLQIIVLVVFHNYYLYVLMILIGTILNNLLCNIETKKRYPELNASNGETSEDLIKEDKLKIWTKVRGVFFSRIGSVVFLSADNIIISLFFGLAVLGKYSNYYYVISTLIALFAIVHNSIRPVIGQKIIKDTIENNFSQFLFLNRWYGWISAFCACCLLSLYQSFIGLWAGADNLLPMYMVYLLGAMFYCGRLYGISSVYVEAAGLWDEGKWIYIIASIVNLSLNIVLSKSIGLPGVVISTLVASIIVLFIGYYLVLFKFYFIRDNMRKTYILNLIENILGQFISIGLITHIEIYFHVSSWLGLLLKGFSVAILFLIVYAIVIVKNKDWPVFFSIIAQLKINRKKKI